VAIEEARSRLFTQQLLQRPAGGRDEVGPVVGEGRHDREWGGDGACNPQGPHCK
jgi:hypothetical protein